MSSRGGGRPRCAPGRRPSRDRRVGSRRPDHAGLPGDAAAPRPAERQAPRTAASSATARGLRTISRNDPLRSSDSLRSVTVPISRGYRPQFARQSPPRFPLSPPPPPPPPPGSAARLLHWYPYPPFPVAPVVSPPPTRPGHRRSSGGPSQPVHYVGKRCRGRSLPARQLHLQSDREYLLMVVLPLFGAALSTVLLQAL